MHTETLKFEVLDLLYLWVGNRDNGESLPLTVGDMKELAFNVERRGKMTYDTFGMISFVPL